LNFQTKNAALHQQKLPLNPVTFTALIMIFMLLCVPSSSMNIVEYKIGHLCSVSSVAGRSFSQNSDYFSHPPPLSSGVRIVVAARSTQKLPFRTRQRIHWLRIFNLKTPRHKGGGGSSRASYRLHIFRLLSLSPFSLSASGRKSE